MRPKVIFLVGGTDPGRCGVADYAHCLAAALQAGGHAKVEVCASWRGWGPRRGAEMLAALRSRGPWDILHVQYPSLGFRYSLVPHFAGVVGIARRTVATLHEHSALPAVQRAASQLFRATADALIFTTPSEATAFAAGRGVEVIPIGSNIPTHPRDPHTLRNRTIINFGQIRPGKGIETFIELAQRARAAGRGWHFLLAGTVPPRYAAYNATLKVEAESTGISWLPDLSAPAIAELLASAGAVHLPFPDGASLRRGSLLAALANGAPVISTVSPLTPDALRDAILPAASAAEALLRLDEIEAGGPDAATAAAATRLAAACSWEEIARRHQSVYARLLTTGPRSLVAG